MTVADCEDQGPCNPAICELGQCEWNPLGLGTAVPDPTSGDCHASECDGTGQVRSYADADDVPADDGDPCTIEACTEGAGGGGSMGNPAHLPAEPGTTCGQNKICDGDGACVDIP